MAKRKSQIIWVAKAHVKSIRGGMAVGNAMGAEVYIAIRADNAEEFEHRARAVFQKNRLQVISINEIENEFDVPKEVENDPVAAEKVELFKRLCMVGVRFAWGKFYPYE